MSMIPLSVPIISGNEWKYVKECLDTGWVSSVGSYVEKFEDTVKSYTQSAHAVAVVNGTAALHLSLIACDILPDDEIIVPTLTFIASVNVIHYCGAKPVFMDCDADTLCLDVPKVADFLKNETYPGPDGFTYNKSTKRRIKAILPVHIFGHPVDMDPLLTLAKQYNLTVIEDATESIGSAYRGRKTGSLAEIACLSFNGNKIITTGGGGMILTQDEALAERMRHLSTQAKSDAVEYDHDAIGYNYRLTNIQAAMGVAQMENLESYLAIKRNNAALYRELLAEVAEVTFLWEQPWAKSNFWFYTIQVPTERKQDLLAQLLANKIQARPIWKLIHTLPMYHSCQTFAIEQAAKAYATCLNLPCSVNLKREDILYVVQQIKECFVKQLSK